MLYYCWIFGQANSEKGLHCRLNRISDHCPDPRLTIWQRSIITASYIISGSHGLTMITNSVAVTSHSLSLSRKGDVYYLFARKPKHPPLCSLRWWDLPLLGNNPRILDRLACATGPSGIETGCTGHLFCWFEYSGSTVWPHFCTKQYIEKDREVISRTKEKVDVTWASCFSTFPGLPLASHDPLTTIHQRQSIKIFLRSDPRK
jgi:hypothetical protein